MWICSYVRLIYLLKEIVHPKILILSSFTHPQVVPNLYECLCSAEHKGRYSEECGNRADLGQNWLTWYIYYGNQWCPKEPGYKLSSKYLPLCSAKEEKIIQVWNFLRVSKWWKNFLFGWTIPLKYIENVSILYFSNQKELPTANEAWPVQSIATELGECLWPIFNYRLPDKPLNN